VSVRIHHVKARTGMREDSVSLMLEKIKCQYLIVVACCWRFGSRTWGADGSALWSPGGACINYGSTSKNTLIS
jgi:hypothetical protein